MPVYQRPGVFQVETDLSQVVREAASDVGVIVGSFKKGPIDKRILITNTRDLITLFGNPDVSYGYALYCAICALETMDKLYITRVVSDDAASSGLLINAGVDEAIEETDVTTTDASTLTASGAGDYFLLNTTDDLGIEYYVWFNVDGGNSDPAVAGKIGIEVNVLNGDLAAAVATKTKTAIDTQSSGEFTIVVNTNILTITNNDAGDTIDASIGTSNFTISITTQGVTGISDYTQLADGLSKGSQETDVNFISPIGEGDGSTLTFIDSLVNLSGIVDLTDLQVGGVSIGPLTINTAVSPWTIASDSLDGILSTLDPDTGDISLVFDSGSTPADGEIIEAFYTSERTGRLFTITAENPGSWGNNLKVTITNIDAINSTFDINIYEVSDGVNSLLESHTVSRKSQLDGFGRQQFLEDVINGNSFYIRVYNNDEVDEATLPNEISTPISLTGGNEGSAVSNADIITGWDLYSNRQDVQIDILINSGYSSSSDATVQSKMKSIAEGRDDCFAILDAPYDELGMTPTTDLTDWRNDIQNFNSSYVALYAPWCEVYDSFNDIKNLPLPPSGFVGQVFSRRAKNTEAWFPPAGFNDGLIDSGQLPFTKLTHRYTDGQQDLIYSAGVNFLLTEPGTGTAVFGDKTEQTKASALDRINVRRLLNVIKRSMRAFLKFQIFELNTEFTRSQVTEALTDFLKGVQARQGLTDFLVVCNDSNNTSTVIDNNQLNVDVYIQPTKSINFIKQETIITRTGVDFNTIINARLPA